jgi:cytochrome P450
MSIAATEPLYDPLVTPWQGDPYTVYGRLRDNHPVYYCGPRGVYVLSRFADVRQAARDWGLFSSAPSVDFDDTGDALLGDGSFIDTDPPDHQRMRKVIQHRFNPTIVRQRFGGGIRRYLDQRVDQLLESERVDLARDLAWALPVATVCMLMGVPSRDVSALRPWFEDLACRRVGDPTPPGHARRAAASLREYLCASVDERLLRPEDDLLGDLAEGLRSGTITRDEVRGICVLLCLAGSETTASLIGNCLLFLDRHPALREALRREPTWIPRAVEEVVRLESPVQYLARTASREFELHDTVVSEGARVILLWGAANRDERAFAEPDAPDLGRTRPRHVGFGEGIHHCIGAPLARLEARLALESILARVDFVLDGPVVRMPSHSAFGLSSLPAVCRARDANSHAVGASKRGS